MVATLPSELLRSLVSVVDTGSIANASKEIFVTPSALSLQMKRLEDILQVSLFHREGRRLKLTSAGEFLLAHAREVISLNDQAIKKLRGEDLIGPARVGIVQDLADALLAGVLARFTKLNAHVELKIKVGRSSELQKLFNNGELDIVLCLGDRNDPLSFAAAPAYWLGHDTLISREEVVLAVLEEPCVFRQIALAALEKSRRKYHIVLETQSLSALRAAIISGLGITCYTSVFFDRSLKIKENLMPELPAVKYSLYVRQSPHRTIEHLSEILRKATLEISEYS